MNSYIKTIEYYLPEMIVTNADLAIEFPKLPIHKLEQMTGISSRHIARSDEYASDLAYRVAQKVFESGSCQPSDIDYLLLCTQTPDYFLPTTASLLQQKLGFSTNLGALDISLGCSGFVYGLGLAKGLIETSQAQNVLLITAETITKFLKKDDRTVRTLFGDGAAAIVISSTPDTQGGIGPFVYGTDGSGEKSLLVNRGGLKNPVIPLQGSEETSIEAPTLYMDGPALFNFSSQIVPEAVRKTLQSANYSLGDIDWFVFHQANKVMLDHLRDKLEIPPEKFAISMKDCGNTGSSSIPIALKRLMEQNQLRSGQVVLVVGFGVGFSWASAIIRWL